MKLFFPLCALFLSFVPISHAVLTASQLAQEVRRHHQLALQNVHAVRLEHFEHALAYAHSALTGEGDSLTPGEQTELLTILATIHRYLAIQGLDTAMTYGKARKFAQQTHESAGHFLTSRRDSLSAREQVDLLTIRASGRFQLALWGGVEGKSALFQEALELVNQARAMAEVSFSDREQAELFAFLALGYFHLAREGVDTATNYARALDFAQQALASSGDSLSAREQSKLSVVVEIAGRSR